MRVPVQDSADNRAAGRRNLFRVLATLLALAALPLSASQAQERARPVDGRPIFHVELAASTLGAEGTGFDEQSLSLRGSRSLGRRWAVEGSMLRFRGADIWIADFSAKRYLRDGRRADWYLTFGPSALVFIEDVVGGDIEPMVHLGAGTEVWLRQRLFLRPELRLRKLVESFDATTIYELTLGIGWRIGSR